MSQLLLHLLLPFIGSGSAPHDARRLTSSLSYTSHPFEGGSGSWASLRIVPVYVGLSALTTEQQMFVENRLVPAAATWWKSNLDVVPVQGPLVLSRFCEITWSSAGKCKQHTVDQKCGGAADDPVIPSTHFADAEECASSASACTTIAGGPGVESADYILYVTAKETSGCGGATLAFAGLCQRDQYDRPVAGKVNFCPSRINTAAKGWHSMVGTAIHEIGHALGFQASSFAYFRRPDGTPMTPRDSETGEPVDGQSLSTCPSGGTASSYKIPSTSTMIFKEERGVLVGKIVTPTVLKMVRSYFSCPTLDGAELENQPTSAHECFGSHWEERLFNTEVMSSTTDHAEDDYSPLTLALLQVSGPERSTCPEYLSIITHCLLSLSRIRGGTRPSSIRAHGRNGARVEGAISPRPSVSALISAQASSQQPATLSVCKTGRSTAPQTTCTRQAAPLVNTMPTCLLRTSISPIRGWEVRLSRPTTAHTMRPSPTVTAVILATSRASHLFTAPTTAPFRAACCQ
jgi:hypothetical protein